MKDIEQYLRDNAPETPAEGQFLIETNARLNAVEGIKKTVDGERRRGRIALIVALAAGLVLGCLITLLVLGLGVSAVVGAYERVVAQLTIVMAFQSMILDMSGNTGTQSLAVTIRVLTDEALTTKEKIKFVFKEQRVGFTNGFLLGLIAVVLVGLYIWLLKGKPIGFAYLVSSCIGVSMWLAMIISSTFGTLIPMFFKKIGVDPAVASGPLITTVNDFIAVVIYYSLCWVFLIGVFHLG